MVDSYGWWKDTVSDKSALFISVALAFYALTTPCPHTLGFVQIAVALCLGASVFFSKPSLILNGVGLDNRNNYRLMAGSAQMAAMLFFITALFGALIRLNGELTLWMLGRDILPYFFVILPLLFLNMGESTANRLTAIIPLVVSFVGIIYSFRFINSVLEQAGSIPLYLGDQIKAYSCGCVQYRISRDAYCFPFDPSVQFSAVYLVLRAVNEISFNKRSLITGAMLIILAAAPIMAMCLLLNRAMLGLLAIALVIYCARSMKRFLAAIVVIVTLTIAMVTAGALITVKTNVSAVESNSDEVKSDTRSGVKKDATTIQNALLQKQKLMGFNNKTGELISLYQDLSQNSPNLIFGLGWGGRFYSPAVGQVASFTHSLLTYAVLKAGLFGLFLMLVYWAWFGHTYLKIGKKFRHELAAELYAVNCVILISLFFQPTYKTPTYGVLLLFVLAACISANKRGLHDVG